MFTRRRRSFGGNPYLFLGAGRSVRRGCAHIILRQHAAGRPLSEILADPYVRRCGGDSFCRRVLVDRRTIEALEAHVRDDLARLHP